MTVPDPARIITVWRFRKSKSFFITANGTGELLRLVIRGFGAGAMHVVCGMAVALGLSFLWDQVWLRVIGGFGLLCAVITFHAVFNVFVNQTGPVFWIGNSVPLMMVLAYLLFFRWKEKLS